MSDSECVVVSTSVPGSALPLMFGSPAALSMHTGPVDSPGHLLSRLFPPEATSLSVDHNRIRGMKVQMWPQHLSCPFLLGSLR